MKAKRMLAGLLALVMTLSLVTLPSYALEDTTQNNNTVEIVEDDALVPTPIEPETQPEVPLEAQPEAQPEQDAEVAPDAAGLLSLGTGLLLYSSFDTADVNGTTVKNLANPAKNGTATAAITYVDGQFGKAIQVKNQANPGAGENKANQYVSYGKGILPATANYAVALWFKSTGKSNNGTVLSDKDYASGSNKGFVIGSYENTTMKDMRVNIGGATSSAGKDRAEVHGQGTDLAMRTMKDGGWHHLATNVDRSGNLSVYVDGVFVKSVSTSAIVGSIDSGLPLVIGADGKFFNGGDNFLMDELRIYDRLLLAAEITELATPPAPPVEAPPELVLHSTFDADKVEGTSVKDSSGKNHHGTAVGGVTFVPGLSGNAVQITGQKNPGQDKGAGDRYVDFGKSEPIVPGTGNFSIAMWYQSIGSSSNATIFSNKNFASGSNTGFAMGDFTYDLRMNLTGKGETRKDINHPTQSSAALVTAKDGAWHHLTVTVNRSGDMIYYVDGVEADKTGRTTISGTKATIEAGLNLVLGAGGNYCSAANNCNFDDLRVYTGALAPEAVTTLYDELKDEAATANAVRELAKVKAELAKIKATIAAMVPSVRYPQAAIDGILAKVAVAETGLAAEDVTLDAAKAIMVTFDEAYQLFLVGVKPTASFHLVSDVHISASNSSDYATVKSNYSTAMENMKTINADTTIAFVNGGDFTNNSSAAEYKDFYDLTAAHNPVGADETLIIQGNHDVRGYAGTGEANWNRDPTKPEKCVEWPAAKARYQEHNAPYFPAGGAETLYHAKELGGYTFIMLNTELGLKDAMYMSPAQITWLEATMKAAYEKNPAKPIFIVGHQPLNDTHWLGNVMDGFDGIKADGTPQPYQTGADAAVKRIMAKYPTGVYLSGHIHNQFDRAEAVIRPYGVAVDLPSFGQGGIGTDAFGLGTGFEVQIYDDTIVFRAVNYVTGEWYPEHDITVPLPQIIKTHQAASAILTTSERDWYSRADIKKLTAAFNALDTLVMKQYDQKDLTWSSTNRAPKQFYQAADHAAIYAAAPALKATLAGLTRLDAPQPDTTFEDLRASWRSFLLGGTGDDLDLTNPATAAYVAELNTDSITHWNNLLKTSDPRTSALFPDLEMTPISGGSDAARERSGNMGTTLQRLATLSMAWATKGCDLYASDYVKEELISATDLVVDNYFKLGKFTNREAYGNWYHWEITAPTALGNIAIVMHDVLGAERVELYAKTAQYYAPYCNKGGPNSPGPGMTGGNLLLKANAVAQAGILLKDESMLENVRAGVKSTVSTYNDPDNLFSTGNAGDGFYADGSYIQHQALPYIAGYGSDLYNNFSIFSIILKGTDWEIKYEADEDPLIYDFVFSGIEPFLYNTCTMDMVTSRAVTRNGYSDRNKTAGMLSSLLPMRGTFPTPEQNARFDSMMKYYLSLDPDYYYARMSSIYAIGVADALLGDESIVPRSNFALTKNFAMDRTVHITPDFGMGIAMQSTRTFAHEIINNEGKRTWNIANGMVFLYDEDEGQFGGGYWASVDPTRLPGITTEHVVYANGKGSLNTNIYDWAGGSSLGNSGAAGMHMRALAKDDITPSYGIGPRTGANMKKSYFMFGDRVLMMGSSITSTTGDHVETTIDNRKIKLDGSNVITVDGAAADLTPEAVALKNPNWLHMQGSVAGADVGYYFPENITVQALKETRTGNWSDQGTTSGTATNTFATLFVDHGAKPTDATYAYVLLPGKTAAETATYAAAPDVEILRQDGNVHAARDRKQGITAANFWAADSAAGITVSAPASVTMQIVGDVLTIGVSDPTQRDVPITVSLLAAGELVSKDERITMAQGATTIEFTVNTTEGLGGTYTASFKLAKVTEIELVSAMAGIAPITADKGTPFSLLPLPRAASFVASDMSVHTLSVLWARGDYNANTAGLYTLVGTPVLPVGVLNTAALTLTARVEIAGEQLLAVGDTYVNDGDKSAVNYGSSGGLAVKNDAVNYRREALFQFDLTTLPADFETLRFAFHAGYDTSGWQTGAVYQVADTWTANTVTWNTKPAKTSETPIATFSRESFHADGVVKLDIKAAVDAAKAAGATKISFLVASTGAAGSKNQLTISSLESSVTQKPALTWTTGAGAPATADKENLNMLITYTEGLNKTSFLSYNSAGIEAAVAAAKLVVAAPDATMNQISDAEDALLVHLCALRIIPTALKPEA